MKRNLLIGLSFIISLILNAQGNQNYGKYYGNFFPQSPNATPFAVYGKYPVNLYKGLPTISIPLFNTQIGAKEFNITLDYNVKSVKPETIPSWAGLGWNLNVGGAISRIVNGGVDEVYQSLQTPYNRYSYLDNYSILDNQNWSSQSALQNYFQNNLAPILQNLPGVVPDPDEFIINIAGITGSFYMNEKGKWIGRTRDGRTFKVEYVYKSDFSLYEKVVPLITKTHHLKRILYGFTITMDDGTKYIFGQDDANIEFTSSNENVDNNFNPQIIPSAWNIKEIDYTDGKTLKFTYERDEKAIFLLNRLGNASFYSQGNSGFFNISNSASSGNYYASSMNRINQVFIKKIEGEDFYINFYHSLANQKEYTTSQDVVNGQGIQNYYSWADWIIIYDGGHHLTSYENVKHWYKLDKINITDKAGNKIKIIDFTFNNDPNDRLLLKNLTLNSIEKYDFKYNAQKLPEYLSDAVDGWGYYNGSNFLASVPISNLSPAQLKNAFQNIYPSYKIPDLNLSKASTLEEITYPTSGKSYFNYELNNYSKFGDKDLSSSKLKIYDVANTTAGGLRIQSIKSCDENNNCYNKSYSYLNDDGTSSGILPYKPIYVIEGNDSNINLNFWEFNMHSYQSLKDEDNSVGYSKVTETDDNGGKKETYFTNFDQPENNDIVGVSYFGWMQPALFKQLPYTSFSLMRGKPKKEIISTSTNKISETIYTYSQQADYLRSYTFNGKQFGNPQPNGPFTDFGGVSYAALLDAHHINFNSSFLSQKETITDGVSSKENYSYNYTYNIPTKIIKTNAGNNYETSFDYASDANNITMIGNYMVGIPISITEKKNGNIFSKTQTNYPGSLPNPQTGNLMLPLSESSYSIQNNTSLQSEFYYNKYDNKGNVLQYTTKDGDPTAIVWGYNKTKPIAKIEGATYPTTSPTTDVPQSLITPIVNSSDADAAAGPGNDESTGIISVLNTFRNDAALKNYMITTFTYDPLVGVRSITPPNGNIEYYKYNTANRLEKVLDKDNNIVKEFKYNYAPKKFYNDQKSQSFTRNNCGSNFIGGSYTYTVPANKYISIISQEDANQQAQNEINANGQNVANINGSCIPAISCAISMSFSGGGGVLETNLNFKASLSFSTGSNSTSLPWTTGVKIGTIQGVCKPSVSYNSYNGAVYYTINTNGDIVIKSQNGIYPNNTTLAFDFYYPKN